MYDPEEIGRHYHYLAFKVACHERGGAAFQTFFEQIMLKHDSSHPDSIGEERVQGHPRVQGVRSTICTDSQCWEK